MAVRTIPDEVVDHFKCYPWMLTMRDLFTVLQMDNPDLEMQNLSNAVRRMERGDYIYRRTDANNVYFGRTAKPRFTQKQKTAIQQAGRERKAKSALAGKDRFNDDKRMMMCNKW